MDGHITVLSIILTFFSGSLILAFNKNNYACTTMLGCILLIFSWHTFIYFAILDSWDVQIPYLLRVGRPFYFALPALSYLYIKYLVDKGSRFSKSDFLHFIPCLLILSDVVFYYFSKHSNIQHMSYQIVKDIPQGSEIAVGFISPQTFLLLKVSQVLIYIGLFWHLLYISYKRKLIFKMPRVTQNWLLLFSVLITAIQLVISYNMCQPYFIISHVENLNPVLISRLLLLLMIFFLFLYPSIIYSTADTLIEEVNCRVPVPKDQDLKIAQELTIFPIKQMSFYLGKIEDLKDDFRFFKSIDSIADLARYLQIPSRHLTYILNHHYHLRFNDFINGHRIRYVIKQFETGFLKELTMEAIAFEAGFSSRSTFFSAFKKYTGQNPSQYLKEQSIKNIT